MSIAQTVAEVVKEHVTLEVEGIDRMYLNVYIPALQRAGGVASFFWYHRGHQCVDGSHHQGVHRADGAVAKQEKVPMVRFEKGQRKDDVAAAYRKKFTAEEGVLFIGKRKRKRRRSAPSDGDMSRRG